MIFINESYKVTSIPCEYAEAFVKLLNPIAPHMTEEIWSVLGHEGTVSYEAWPTYDESKLVSDTVEIIVQVNGKLRDKIEVANGTAKDKLEELALADEKVKKFTNGKNVVKVIVIPNKIVNIVVK